MTQKVNYDKRLVLKHLIAQYVYQYNWAKINVSQNLALLKAHFGIRTRSNYRALVIRASKIAALVIEHREYCDENDETYININFLKYLRASYH